MTYDPKHDVKRPQPGDDLSDLAKALRVARPSGLPTACAKCGQAIRKFATGAEIPCADCGGRLCERCCDARKRGA